MKELSPNLYGVIVPEMAERFLPALNGNVFITYDIGANRFEVVTNQIGEIEILGTASEKEINFDCEPFIGAMFFELVNPITGNYIHYKAYNNEPEIGYFDKNKSFLSLIKSKGIDLKPNEKLLVIKKV